MESLTRYAIYYAKRGLQVFPCKPCAKEPLGTLVPHGLLEATTDLGTIRQWWALYPDANIGIRTGAESEVVVLDVDAGRGGEEAFSALMDQHGLPDTWITNTGGGGFHLWFAHPGGPVASTKDVVCQGVEVKGEGRYVVVPPSIHPNGTPYSWGVKMRDVESASLPGWVVGRMNPITQQRGKARANPVIGTIREGSRNDALASLAGTLRSRGFEYNELIVSLNEINKRCTPPLSESEVEDIAKSIARYPPGVVATPRLTIRGASP